MTCTFTSISIQRKIEDYLQFVDNLEIAGLSYNAS